MPKATTEGGATNAWEPRPDPLLCAECGAQVAPGAPRCPECPSTSFEAAEVPVEEAVAELAAAADGDAQAAGELAEANERLAAAAQPEPEPADEGAPDEAPAEPQVPDAEPAPAASAPPRTPPRRA